MYDRQENRSLIDKDTGEPIAGVLVSKDDKQAVFYTGDSFEVWEPVPGGFEYAGDLTEAESYFFLI